jgi:hypothetical protein
MLGGAAGAVAVGAGVAAKVVKVKAGPVLVVVVVTIAIVEPIVVGCCNRAVGKVLYCLVGVTSGA